MRVIKRDLRRGNNKKIQREDEEQKARRLERVHLALGCL